MMSNPDIRHFIAKWEGDAAAYARSGSSHLWEMTCARIWTAEFILGEAQERGYISPVERIPFPAREVRSAA